ncbi:hypothetical protein [Streptomyces rubiginosohelvolus]
MGNIKQNLFFALVCNAVGILRRRRNPFAVGALYPLWGVLLSPITAAPAMAPSPLAVVAAASRLLRWYPVPLPEAVGTPTRPEVGAAADTTRSKDGTDGRETAVDPVSGMEVDPAASPEQ